MSSYAQGDSYNRGLREGPQQRRRRVTPSPYNRRLREGPQRPRIKAPHAPRAPRKPVLGVDPVGDYGPAPSAAESVQLQQTPFTGGTGGYDVGSDPAVARIGALSQRMRAEAQASAAAKRKQATLEYGDPTGIEGIDEATAKAARENPFSILAQMKHSYDLGVGDLEEGLNKANLFYSGYRGQQLGEAANTYQQGRYDAGNRFRATITDINDALAAALMNADMMDADAIGGSDGGYYDPGDGWLDQLAPEDDPLAAATGKPKAKPKPKQKPKTVRVAGKTVPLAAAKKQLNRAISEAKLRAKPRPKPKPRPKRTAGGK